MYYYSLTEIFFEKIFNCSLLFCEKISSYGQLTDRGALMRVVEVVDHAVRRWRIPAEPESAAMLSGGDFEYIFQSLSGKVSPFRRTGKRTNEQKSFIFLPKCLTRRREPCNLL